MATDELITRLVLSRFEEAMGLSRLVLLEGPRACGKSTVLRMLHRVGVVGDIVDLSDHATRQAAADDPRGFVESLSPPVAVDEVQLVPDLALAFKRRVDESTSWGPAILTGSSPVARGQLGGSDPLVGRAVRLRLRPLSRRELNGRPDHILDLLTDPAATRFTTEPLDRDAYLRVATSSGFPDAASLDPPAARRWFGTTYADGVLPRALDDENRRVNPQMLRQVLRSLGASPASELNTSHLAQRLEMNRDTVASHVGLLRDLGLVDAVPGWRRGASKRHIARPKVHPADGALSGWSIGPDPTDQESGGLIESMVYRELAAQADNSFGDYEVHHWRTQRHEVDLLLTAHGRFVPIEVKLARSLPRSAARGIDAFAAEFPDRFVRGLVFYAGDAVVPLGPDRLALPISTLWATPASDAP